jgi:hypothetical protein
MFRPLTCTFADVRGFSTSWFGRVIGRSETARDG